MKRAMSADTLSDNSGTRAVMVLYLALAIVAVTQASNSLAASELTVTSGPRPFRVETPDGWVGEAPFGNVRYGVSAPDEKHIIGCNVSTARLEHLHNQTQAQLSAQLQRISDANIVRGEYLNDLNNVRVIATKPTTLGGYPARSATISAETIRYGTTVYMKQHIVVTLVTPATSVTVACAGMGLEPQDADAALEYWQPTVDRFLRSVRLLPRK